MSWQCRQIVYFNEQDKAERFGIGLVYQNNLEGRSCMLVKLGLLTDKVARLKTWMHHCLERASTFPSCTILAGVHPVVVASTRKSKH